MASRTSRTDAAAGTFNFTQAFTQGPNPNTASTAAGDAIASFLLGYPASGSVQVATPGHFFVDYYAGYIQDDYRVSSALTLNYGLRYEYETGLKEEQNHFTVGFDRNAAFPIQVPGVESQRGPDVRRPEWVSDPAGPARCTTRLPHEAVLAWSLNTKTVVRGGWGLFWAPTQYPATGEAALGSRGYSASTTFLSSNDGGLTPAGSLSNPFPNGITPPQGNSLGLLTGAGGVIDFADQNAKPGYVQQYSVDFQRELPGGNVDQRRLRRQPIRAAQHRRDQRRDDQHQPARPELPGARLGAAAAGPEPVLRHRRVRQLESLGDDRARTAAAAVSAVRQRAGAPGQPGERALQRVRREMGQTAAATGGAMNANYTYSRLKDNQFGEANFYASRIGSALNNYDLDSEYGYSLNDVPHRLNVSATFELPFGRGKRWLSSGDGIGGGLLGGWAFTVVGRYQNGFPANISQSSNNSGLFGSTQRPNVVSGASPVNSGNADDNYDRGVRLHPCASIWRPGRRRRAFTFGNAPRTDPNARTYGQAETDINIQKAQRLGGKTITVRADLLNIFDNPLLLGPVSTFGTCELRTGARDRRICAVSAVPGQIGLVAIDGRRESSQAPHTDCGLRIA